MRNKKYLSLLFLAVYLLFIFYITLFSRSFSLTHDCRLELFYSYGQWLHGSVGTGKQILLNIALFVPAGYFLAEALHAWNVKRTDIIRRMKNEITRTMRCGKYRVFVRDIPTEYHVTAVRTGFYENKKVTWDRYFRVK